MRLTFYGILIICCTSCYTYKVFPKSYRTLPSPTFPVKAHVLNPQLKHEYQILKQSGLFELTDLHKADITINLDSMTTAFVCGQPLVVTMATLGQLPVYLPDRYFFRFEEHRPNETISHQIELQVAKRIWFWDLFNPNKKFRDKAAIALRGGYQTSGRDTRNLSN